MNKKGPKQEHWMSCFYWLLWLKAWNMFMSDWALMWAVKIFVKSSFCASIILILTSICMFFFFNSSFLASIMAPSCLFLSLHLLTASFPALLLGFGCWISESFPALLLRFLCWISEILMMGDERAAISSNSVFNPVDVVSLLLHVPWSSSNTLQRLSLEGSRLFLEK